MAKKTEDLPNIVDIFAEFKELKNIDNATVISVLEESFRNVLAKSYGTDENFEIVMNPERGDVQIFQNLIVVPDGEVTEPNKQISLSDARANNDPDVEVGEEHSKVIVFQNFGRRDIVNLRQTLQSKILDLQKEALYNKFKDMEGQLVAGEVYQTWSRETLLLDHEKNELILPKSESIPRDYFRKGETVQAVILKVDNKNNNPKITVSRTSDMFLRRLFERDVPEILDGLINIKAVARIPGERAKIAVESYDDRIDPVGACVGPKGSRIHGIVRELRNENIDVISYTANPELFIQRALSPAKISSIRIDPEEMRAEVFLKPEEISLAIGKGGSNIKLASLLTGYELEVYRDTETEAVEEDIYIDEFRDEIEDFIIDAVKAIGLTTAKKVLNAPRELLTGSSEGQADLEEEQADRLISVLREEFER